MIPVKALRRSAKPVGTNGPARSSLLTHSSASLAQGGASHLSIFTCHPSPIPQPLTSHFSPLTAAPAAPRCASRISSLYYARLHRALRSRPRPRIRLGGVLEYWSVGVLRFVRIAPRLRGLAGALNASILGCGGSQLTDQRSRLRPCWNSLLA
jgi:hypothetical protein